MLFSFGLVRFLVRPLDTLLPWLFTWPWISLDLTLCCFCCECQTVPWFVSSSLSVCLSLSLSLSLSLLRLRPFVSPCWLEVRTGPVPVRWLCLSGSCLLPLSGESSRGRHPKGSYAVRLWWGCFQNPSLDGLLPKVIPAVRVICTPSLVARFICAA